MSVGEPTAEDARWQSLAAELTPAKSLGRIDTVTGRVVSTVSVVSAVLTGLGLVAADRLDDGLPRSAALVAVVLAVLALVAALAAQVLTITRGLNTNNLLEVEHWYRTRFARRAPLAWVASVLLVAAAVAAGLAGVSAAVGGDPVTGPQLALTRTTDLLDDGTPGPTGSITVSARATGLEPGAVLELTVTLTDPEKPGDSSGMPVVRVAVAADDVGVAAREVTVPKVAVSSGVTVVASVAGRVCRGVSGPGPDSAADGAWQVDC